MGCGCQIHSNSVRVANFAQSHTMNTNSSLLLRVTRAVTIQMILMIAFGSLRTRW